MINSRGAEQKLRKELRTEQRIHDGGRGGGGRIREGRKGEREGGMKGRKREEGSGRRGREGKGKERENKAMG